MNIEEARLYLEHTSKEDFNLEEHQKENRYQAIQVVLKEIERLNNILTEIENIIEEDSNWIYNDPLEIRENFKVIDSEYLLNKLKELKGSDKE